MSDVRPWTIMRVWVLSKDSSFANLADTKVEIGMLRESAEYGAETMECGKLPGTITASTWYEVKCTYVDG